MSSGASGAIKGGMAYVQAFLDDNPITQGLAKLQTKLKTFQAGLSSMAASTMGGQLPEPFAAIARFAQSPAGAFSALLGAAKCTAAAREEMLRLSESCGVGVEKLSAMSYAARRAGLSNEALASGLKKMQAREFIMGLQAAGGKKPNLLAGLGIDPKSKQDAVDTLRQVAKQFEGLNDVARAGLARKLGISELLPLLNQGVDAIDAFTQRAKDLGLVMSEEDAKSGKKFEQALGDLHDVLMSSVKAIGGALVPMITGLTNVLIPVVVGVRDWIKEHKALVVGIFLATGAIVLGGIALKGMAVVSGIASTALSVLQFAMKAVSLAFAVNPMTLLIAGLIAAGIYIANAMGWFDGLKEKFDRFMNDIKGVFTGISNAISAGKLGLAMDIAMAGVKVAFLSGLNALDNATGGWVTKIAKMFVQLVRGIGELWNKAVTGIARGLLKIAQDNPALGKAMGIEVKDGKAMKAQAVGQARGILEQTKRDRDNKATHRNNIPELEREIAMREKALTRMTDQSQIATQKKIIGQIKDEIKTAQSPKESAAMWDGIIKKAEKNLADAQAKSEADYGSDNALNASGALNQQSDAWLKDWETKMDGWMNTASNFSQAEQDARDNLEKLKKEAADAAEAMKKEKDKPKGDNAFAAGAAAELRGTFSGAVAGMLGGGGGIAAQQLNVADRQLKTEEEQSELLRAANALREKQYKEMQQTNATITDITKIA